jgi:hypothetical protein
MEEGGGREGGREGGGREGGREGAMTIPSLANLLMSNCTSGKIEMTVLKTECPKIRNAPSP